MRFLKVLFWLLLGGLVAAFVMNNASERIGIHLWGDLVADFSVPFLLILVFLAGLLPMLLAHHAYRWRTRQQLAGLERALTDLRAITPEPGETAVEPYSPPAPPLIAEGA